VELRGDDLLGEQPSAEAKADEVLGVRDLGKHK
jgi:hypothetical protein